jgi:hypothetical protein
MDRRITWTAAVLVTAALGVLALFAFGVAVFEPMRSGPTAAPLKVTGSVAKANPAGP